jgi:hypothetical protein
VGLRSFHAPAAQVEFEKPEMKLETLLEYGNLLVQEQENVKRVQLADSYLSGAELAGARSFLPFAAMRSCCQLLHVCALRFSSISVPSCHTCHALASCCACAAYQQHPGSPCEVECSMLRRSTGPVSLCPCSNTLAPAVLLTSGNSA